MWPAAHSRRLRAREAIMIALHRSRCVDWRPKPIVCFATTTTTTVRGDRDEKNKVESTSAGVDPAGEEVTLLAVARASGRVEVWKKTQRVDSVVKVHGERRGAAASWLKVKDVPGIKSVVCKSLAWVRPRGGQLKLVGGTAVAVKQPTCNDRTIDFFVVSRGLAVPIESPEVWGDGSELHFSMRV